MNSNPFDVLPIWAVYFLTFGLMLAAAEIGFRAGRAWQRRTPDVKEEGPSGALAGVTLGLLAFLLAFVVGLAAARFDNRKGLVLTEANAIGTTYLRAGFLPEPHQAQAKELLTEYVDIRLAVINDPATLESVITRSNEILNQLWAVAEATAAEPIDSELRSLFVSTLNDTIDINTERSFAVTSTRLPVTLVFATYFISTLGLFLVGFSHGIKETRGIIPLVVTVLVFSVVLLLIIDLDRPQEGFLRVSQQPMIELQTYMHANPPS